MKKKLLFVIVAILVVVPTANGGSGREYKIASLRDIGPLDVLIEPLREDGERAGISDSELKTLIELKLRQNGITVVDAKDNPLVPNVYVNVNIIYLQEFDHYIYNISIALLQIVRLHRNNSPNMAATWDRQYLGIQRADRVRPGLPLPRPRRQGGVRGRGHPLPHPGRHHGTHLHRRGGQG